MSGIPILKIRLLYNGDSYTDIYIELTTGLCQSLEGVGQGGERTLA